MARPQRAHLVRPAQVWLATPECRARFVGFARPVQACEMVVALGAMDTRDLSYLARRSNVRDLARAVPLGRALAGVRRRFADGPRLDRVRADCAATLTALRNASLLVFRSSQI